MVRTSENANFSNNVFNRASVKGGGYKGKGPQVAKAIKRPEQFPGRRKGTPKRTPTANFLKETKKYIGYNQQKDRAGNVVNFTHATALGGKIGRLAYDPLIPKISFQRVVRDISNAYKPGIKWQLAALSALQEATEMCIVELFDGSGDNCIHASRQTVMVRDAALYIRTKNEKCMIGHPYANRHYEIPAPPRMITQVNALSLIHI